MIHKTPQYAFKGVWIPADVWSAVDITWMEKCLVAEIDALDDGDGCFASNAYLAAKFGSTASSIANQISRLRKLGYVETVPTKEGEPRRLRFKEALHQPVNPPSLPSEAPLHQSVNAVYKRGTKGEKGSPPAPVWTSVFIPPALDTPKFAGAWALWHSDRAKRKSKPYTEQGCALLLSDLNKMGHDRAIAAILHSVKNQYQGVYEEKGNGKPAPPAKKKLPTPAERRAEVERRGY